MKAFRIVIPADLYVTVKAENENDALEQISRLIADESDLPYLDSHGANFPATISNVCIWLTAANSDHHANIGIENVDVIEEMGEID